MCVYITEFEVHFLNLSFTSKTRTLQKNQSIMALLKNNKADTTKGILGTAHSRVSKIT
jgi:hypothetical protein